MIELFNFKDGDMTSVNIAKEFDCYDKKYEIKMLKVYSSIEVLTLNEVNLDLIDISKAKKLKTLNLKNLSLKDLSLNNEIERITLSNLRDLKRLIINNGDSIEEINLSDISESKSFSSWLNELNDESSTQKKQSTSEKKMIQQFVHFSKEKQKASFFSPATMAKKSTEENEDLVTETLAEIFVKQQNFEKAIKTYEKLSLLFPEKKPYFASKIESLKKNKS